MRRIARYFKAKQFNLDLQAEMQAHVEERIDELVEQGLAPDEARAKAVREFGNRTHFAEVCRERWAFKWVDETIQDVNYALRLLARNPVFAAVAILSLALGIGACTIVFGVVDHVLLKHLPYAQPDRLFAVWSRAPQHGDEPMHISAADFYDWRAQSHAFSSLSAFSSWPMNLTNVDDPRRLETQLVSANLFSTLGVDAEIGRTFGADEDQEQSAPVVVLSHHLWRELGGSAQILGRQITLNGSAATVVGVMPASFAFPTPEIDAWIPLSLSAANRANRDGRWLSVIGRLNEHATERDAESEMDVIARRLGQAYPASNKGWGVSLVGLQEQLIGKTRPILLALQAAALLLVLITCANLANLLLAKGAARSREIAVRAALGASHGRISRQLLVESLVLATCGGLLGFGVAIPAIALVRKFATGLVPRASEIHMSPSVALFAMGMTLATVLIFGLIPAVHACRRDLILRTGSGTHGTPRHMERKRGILILIEVGIASILLVGAGLLGETIAHLHSTPTGFRTDHLLTMRMTLPHSRYPTIAAQTDFFDEVLSNVRKLPGVIAAGEISDTPLKGNNPTLEFTVDGLAQRASAPPVQAGLRVVSAGYLAAAGVPLLKGRDFTSADRAGAPAVCLVNQSWAKRYWPGADPMGKKLRIKDDQQWMTVVGLVPDVKHMGLREDEGPVVYVPYAQKTQEWLAWATLVVRTAGAPLDFVRAIRGAVRQADKTQPVGEISTLDDVLARSTAIPRLSAATLAVLSGLALLIAVIGVYGLLTYTITQRFPEIAIRLALGAAPRHIASLLLRQAMLRVTMGVAAGLMCAGFLTRYLQSLLFGVHPNDPGIFAAVAVGLLISSFCAVVYPALRILKIDPAQALRTD